MKHNIDDKLQKLQDIYDDPEGEYYTIKELIEKTEFSKSTLIRYSSMYKLASKKNGQYLMPKKNLKKLKNIYIANRERLGKGKTRYVVKDGNKKISLSKAAKLLDVEYQKAYREYRRGHRDLDGLKIVLEEKRKNKSKYEGEELTPEQEQILKEFEKVCRNDKSVNNYEYKGGGRYDV